MCAVEYPRESRSFDLQESQEACKHLIWPEEKGVEVKAETGRMEVCMIKYCPYGQIATILFTVPGRPEF